MNDDRLSTGQRLWLQDAARTEPHHPPLRGRQRADIAIIGGGMTGALAAQGFAAAGADTVLLEGGHIGRGSTAASSALLLQEPDHELGKLVAKYGLRRARRMWALSRDSARSLVRLLRARRISCGLETQDALYLASRDDLEVQRREYELRARLGFAGEWLGPAAIRRRAGMTAPGGICTTGGAHFDPYRACLGIVAAAVRDGARVHERSPVSRITATRHGVEIRTPGGTVSAARAVIATGYATEHFRPLAGRFEMFRTYVLATEPASAEVRRELGLRDVMVWNSDRPYHYARWTADGRLLLGGGDIPVRPGQQRSRLRARAEAGLRAHFEERLPAVSMLSTAYLWEGLFAVTADSLPYIGPHPRYPHQWFALGYGGNGLTFAHLAARLLVDRWQGRTSRDHDLFAFNRLQR